MAKLTSPEDQKAQMAQPWNLISSSYDTIRFQLVAADRLVSLAQVQRGESVLDVATGTGMVALAAAELTGPSGLVVGIDIAHDMLHQAQRKIDSARLTNISVKEGDAGHLEFESNSFDVVLCASSIFWLPDPYGALQEWRRVLKPNGRVLFSTFGEGFWKSPMLVLFQERLKEFGVLTRVWDMQKLLTSSELCYGILGDAQFTDASVLSEQHGYYFETADEYWQETTNTISRVSISRLPVQQLAQFRSEHLAEVGKLAKEKGIWRDLPINFASGRKP